MFEANIWFWLFLLGSGPSKEQLAAEIREGIEAERIANDPVHRARRAREEAQRIADEKAQRKADEKAQRKAREEAQRIANDPVRIAQQEADAVELASEFALIFKVGCWLFPSLFLVYGLSMWLVVPMVDGPKRKSEAAQSTADAAQRSADDAYSSALDAQSRADYDAAMRKAYAAQRKADEAQRKADEAQRMADEAK